MTGVGKIMLCCLMLLGSLLIHTRALAATSDSTVTMELTPAEINVGIFYHGTEVRVEARIPACDGAVLVLEGETETVTLNRKGREAGIWLNVAQVMISHAPRVYILAASRALGDICSEDIRKDLGLGLQSLRGRLQITSDKTLAGTEVDEFLKLKERAGTYNTDLRVALTPEGDGQKLLASLLIPATVPPGQYRLNLYCFAHGEPVFRGSSDLSIGRVGLARIMASLAHEHSAAYGVLAIVVAMTVGIVMGLVFHSLPGSGH
jgi:uncharacterized protein (TIGR02186 family)